jgi:predicted aspartyl protease
MVNVKVIGKKEKSFEALLDTGASYTCIPLEDCIDLGLTFSGTHFTRGLFGGVDLPVFDCQLEIAGNVCNAKILGLPTEVTIGSEVIEVTSIAILGRDYLSNFKLTLDWKSNPPQGTLE